MTVDWNGDALLRAARAGAERGLVQAAEEVRSAAVELMLSSPRSGRTYRRRGVIHRASGPGEPPAPDTGNLLRSVRTEYDLPNLTGTVVAAAAYAAPLEFGTARMAPRPFMRPALARERDKIQRTIARAVVDAISAAAR